MDAIVLALLGGVFFGIMAVFLRIGLGRVVDPELGALHTQAVGFATALVVVAAVTRFGTLTWSGLWPFFALGLVVPGITQVMWTRAVGDIGASRAMVITGTIPLASSIAAIIFLSEPLRAPLALGTVLIVAGAVVLAWDRARPPNYRAIGVLWAAGSIGLFATRDTISRWVVVDREISGVGAAAALLAGASIAVFIYIVVTRQGKRPLEQIRSSVAPFIGAGVFFGAAYLTLMESINRGKITVVVPLLGTFVLWTVVFSAIFLRQTEAISRRLVFAAVLVVAGATVVGVAR